MRCGRHKLEKSFLLVCCLITVLVRGLEVV